MYLYQGKEKNEIQTNLDKIPPIGVSNSKAEYFRINLKADEKDPTKTDVTTKLIK